MQCGRGLGADMLNKKYSTRALEDGVALEAATVGVCWWQLKVVVTLMVVLDNCLLNWSSLAQCLATVTTSMGTQHFSNIKFLQDPKPPYGRPPLRESRSFTRMPVDSLS